MKINELLNEQEQLDEIEPGVVPSRLSWKRYVGQGKRNAQMLKQDKQVAKQLYNQWNSYAVRINKALAGDAELIPKSVEYFKSFISKALRIPANSEVFDKIEDILGTNGMNYKKETAMAALEYAVSQRATAQLGTKTKFGTRGAGGGSNPSGNPPSIPGGTTEKAGGVEYVWNGSEWRNSATGATATAPIAAALTAQVTGRTTP